MASLVRRRRRSPLRQVVLALAGLTLAPPAPALVGAEVDESGRYAAVVWLEPAPGHRCTATKIGPRSLLTAAHCLVEPRSGRLLAALRAPRAAVRLGNASRPPQGEGALRVEIEGVSLAPAYASALERLAEYKEARPGRRIAMNHHFGARFPDVAILSLAVATPGIPTLPVDLAPPEDGASVVLVGYGCRGVPARERGSGAFRTWGRTRVIRVDPVNLYSEAGQKSPGAPSLCPGDSGGPVLHRGRVVAVHGTVYGLHARHGARSNMAANLGALRSWGAWP